jgi:peptide/nickel transport system permease protein
LVDLFLLLSTQHFFCTYNLGRDLFSRILHSTRISLAIAGGATLIAQGLATVIGLLSGYFGGWLDKLLERVIDIWLAVPVLILLISALGLVGTSFWSMTLAIGLLHVPVASRLIRSVVLGLRNEVYVEAARSLGATHGRVMVRHIMPNAYHMIIYSVSSLLGTAILISASLGFLGFGVPPPQPELGSMLSGAGLQYMRVSPWLALWPGLVITLLVFAFNVLGDALRDWLDPRQRLR